MNGCTDFRMRYLDTLYDVAERAMVTPGTWNRLRRRARLLYGAQWTQHLITDLTDARAVLRPDDGTPTGISTTITNKGTQQ